MRLETMKKERERNATEYVINHLSGNWCSDGWKEKKAGNLLSVAGRNPCGLFLGNGVDTGLSAAPSLVGGDAGNPGILIFAVWLADQRKDWLWRWNYSADSGSLSDGNQIMGGMDRCSFDSAVFLTSSFYSEKGRSEYTDSLCPLSMDCLFICIGDELWIEKKGRCRPT